MAQVRIALLAALLAIGIAIANAHFIGHPGRFSNGEKKLTSHESESNSESNSETETETKQPEHHQWHHHDDGHRHNGDHHNGFPEGIRVDDNILDDLCIRIKHELEQVSGINSEDEQHRYHPNVHHGRHHQQSEDEDFDVNWDADLKKMPIGDFYDSSATSKGWKREFAFSKILVVSKNGTKSFAKTRSSTRAEGAGDISITGSLNTTLNVKATGNADFGVNVTYTSKGKDVPIKISGGATSKSSSSSKVGNERLLSKSSANSEVTIDIHKTKPEEDDENVEVADPFKVTTLINSKSETFVAPFRTFLSLFSTSINSTTKFSQGTINSDSVLKGEVTSHVIFVKNGTSLTRLKIKAYMTSNSSEGLMQLVLIKAKTHIFAKVVSKSENGAIVEIFSETKTKAYGKGVTAEATVYYGTGSVACEKSEITLSSEDAQDLHSSQSGMHIINNRLTGDTFIHSALLSSIHA